METTLVLIIGLVIGLLSHFTKPSHSESSLIHCLILGIAGATIGASITATLGFYSSKAIATYVGATLGATITESILRKANNRQLH